MKIKLDAKDRKILCLLDKNSRTPVSALAKSVGLSREVVNYRIKQMEKKKIIEGYYTAIDICKLGYTYFRIFLKYGTISSEQERKMLEYCRKLPIGWIAVGSGRWNLTLVVWAKTNKEFEDVYNDFMEKFGMHIDEHYVSFAFKIYHLNHNYLFDTNDYRADVLGDYQDMKFHDTDIKIIKLLASNARESTVSISERTGISAPTVMMKIRKLLKDKIILRFRAKINTNILGYEHHKIFLKLQNMNLQNKENLVNYLMRHKNVIYITKAVGISDLEFEIMMKNSKELYEFMKQLKCSFEGMIRDYDSILYYSEPLINYMPS